MKPIYFTKAGKFRLTRFTSAGALSTDPADIYFRNGAIQSMVPTININTTSLPDGNSDFAAAEPDTGKEGNILINLSFMPIDLYAFIMETTVEDLVDTPMPAIDVELTVPEASPFTVTLDHTPDTTRPIILVDADASAWVKVADTPAVGQYSVSAALVTFNSEDAGKSVFINYDWTALTAKSFGLSKSGSRKALHLEISDEATGEDETTMYDSATIVDRCKVTGNINPPEKSKEPKPQGINFKVLKPRGNKKAVDFKFAPRA